MKKKLLLVISIMLCVVCFAACGKKDEGENVRGAWKDNVYTNEFIDVTFNLPDKWTYATDEEMNNAFQSTNEVVSENDKVFMEVSELKSLNEMMAQNLYTGSNVIIAYENLSMTVGGSKMTAEEYLDVVKSQLETVETFKYKIGEASKAKIGGNEYVTLEVSVDETEIVQLYYIRKVDNYMVNIIVTSSNKDESVASIMENFK